MIKLNKEELDKIIIEEFQRLQIEHNLKQNRTYYKQLQEQTNIEPRIKIERMNGEIIDYNETEQAVQNRKENDNKEAIRSFQRFYRKLTHDQSYSLRQWLKKNLLNDLTMSQIEEITSRIVSATKGLSTRKNPMEKPK